MLVVFHNHLYWQEPKVICSSRAFTAFLIKKKLVIKWIINLPLYYLTFMMIIPRCQSLNMAAETAFNSLLFQMLGNSHSLFGVFRVCGLFSVNGKEKVNCRGEETHCWNWEELVQEVVNLKKHWLKVQPSPQTITVPFSVEHHLQSTDLFFVCCLGSQLFKMLS